MKFNITKSSRHSKIIGNFGEQIICNWLSKYGFEVALIDHVGIDIIAYNPKSEKKLGISVKSRTRSINKKDNDSVNLYYSKNRKQIFEICTSFSCEPWLAIYVETLNKADIYLTSLDNYERKYDTGSKMKTWKMSRKYREKYQNDERVKHISFEITTENWI